MTDNNQHDLAQLLRSFVPFIVIETHEELRVTDLLSPLAVQMFRPLYQWSVSAGLKRIDLDSASSGRK